MSRRDYYHDTVKRAREADGWRITHDPYRLTFGGTDLYVDMAAEGPLEKQGRLIAVEVKSFLGPSEVTDLERALGQYAINHALMRVQDPDRELFLAVPERVYEGLFRDRDAQLVIAAVHGRILAFDPEKEAITSWQE